MNEKNLISDDELDARLASEAGNHSPEFSHDLHERIMRQVANAPARAPRFTRQWSAIAAAMIVVMGLVAYMKTGSRVNPPSQVIVAIPSMPQIHNPVRALDQPMTKWNDARYAYLDRDGQKLIAYMTRQVDVVPTQKSR